MAYKLEVDNPQFPKGYQFDCDGILVENGKSKTLTKEEELAFISRWGKEVKHFYGHGETAKVTGSSELSKKEREEAMPPEPEEYVSPEVAEAEAKAGIVREDEDEDDNDDKDGGE